ncbi:MAG: TonB-dependent receptor [Acidobacteria bacterium]|nr:TonB-dependent receptor [Acidobacteriota bacterium]
MFNSRQMRYVVAAAILAAWLGALGYGQTTTGTILGVVSDEMAARVPGVTVTITNLDTGIARTLTTDGAGRYRAVGLPLGQYEVKVELAGFRTAARRGIELTVGAEMVVDLTLTVGTVTERIEITAEAPLVETTNAAVSGLVSDQQVRELPLNGRSFEGLAILQPGVAPFYRGDRTTESGAGMKFSVSGSRFDANSFFLDGTLLNDQSNTSPGSAAGVMLGVETLREFRVLTSNYSAEFGVYMGGVVNAVTKSGTNSLQGSVFYFLRNDKLDARNFFDRKILPDDPRIPPFKRNQYGFTVGGPVVKDRTFFFGSYEGLRERRSKTTVGYLPIPEAREGRLRNAAGQFQQVGTGSAFATVKPYLDILPLANGEILTTPTGILTNTVAHYSNPAAPTNEDFFMVRLDHQISDGHSIFGRYTISDSDDLDPGNLPISSLVNVTRNQYVTLGHTGILSSTVVNVARAGLARSYSISDNQLLIDVPKSLYFFPDQQMGRIAFQSGGLSPLFNITNYPQRYAHNVWQASDDLSIIRGSHSLKMGFMVDRIQSNMQKQQVLGGLYTFRTLDDFLKNVPFQLGSFAPDTDWIRGWRQSIFGVYLQDDIQVRPNFTLNVGLRWEVGTVPTEANGKLANYWDPGGSDTVLNPHIGNPWYKGTKKDFGPRIGLAWDPFSNGKTSVRAGFSVHHGHTTGMPYNRVMSFTYPFRRELTLQTSDGLTFPHPNPSSYVNPDPMRWAQGALDPVMKDPTKVGWSFTIQQQLATNTVMTVGYVGAQSSHLVYTRTGNPAVTAIDAASGRKYVPQPARSLNPKMGNINFYFGNGTNASYHGLQLGLTRRLAQGLQTQVSYTWSKTLAESDGAITRPLNIDGLQGSPGLQDPENAKADKGLSQFDQRHSFATSFSYELPFARGATGVAGGMFSGWAMNGILTLRSGNPQGLVLGFDRSFSRVRGGSNGDRPELKPGGDNNPVLGGPDRYYDPTHFTLQPLGYFGSLGRDTLIAPGYASLDVSVNKNFGLGGVCENCRLQFRAEGFNVLNRANFGLPYNQPLTTTGGPQARAGRIDKTLGDARQMQFGLKLTF